MGQIIDLENRRGEPPDVLTSTGRGGFLSAGYLHDDPAAAGITEGETPQFVVTDSKNGVRIERANGTERVRPDSGYRAIGVITDERLLLFVGSADGDRRFTVRHSEIEQVDSASVMRNGRLTFRRNGDTRWHVHCGSKELSELTAYLTQASQAWVRVENIIDEVKQKLVTATERRNQSDHDAALAAAKDASSRLEAAADTAAGFAPDRPGDALVTRVEIVRKRCLATLSEVRVGRARQATTEGESHWRDHEYVAAYETYERAREEYDAVLELPDDAVTSRETVRTERDRVERALDQLEQSPLRKAVAADNEAIAAADPAEAAARWADAMDAYRTVLELDWGEDQRRFRGDPEKIRDRLGTVAEKLTTAHHTVATDAMEAGDWYADAGQHDAALDSYRDARTALERTLDTARDCYPDAVEHVETELAALDRRIERTEARRDDASAADDDSFEERAEDVDVLGYPDDAGTETDTVGLAEIEAMIDADAELDPTTHTGR